MSSVLTQNTSKRQAAVHTKYVGRYVYFKLSAKQRAKLPRVAVVDLTAGKMYTICAASPGPRALDGAKSKVSCTIHDDIGYKIGFFLPCGRHATVRTTAHLGFVTHFILARKTTAARYFAKQQQ